MDIITVFQTLWPCISEKYPELAGGVLQVVGAASVIVKFAGAAGASGSSSGGIGSIFNLLSGLALNRK